MAARDRRRGTGNTKGEPGGGPALPLCAHFLLEGRWLSALPAAVLDALPVDLLFSTFDAALAAALLVTFPLGTDDHLLRAPDSQLHPLVEPQFRHL